MKTFVNRLFLVLAVIFALTLTASAQTDIASAVTSMTTLWDAIEVIAIGVIVFVVGRKLFRKI
jgi:hypothetical protein